MAGEIRAWSCFTKGDAEDATQLYRDKTGRRYAYDSNVVNHSNVHEGDILILRDAHLVYGYGVVESIDRAPDVKVMDRCPECGSADVKRRTRSLPPWRCNDCKNTFEAPVPTPKDVMTYSASYTSWWFEFPSPVPVRALEPVYAGADQQNAIRRLDVAQALALLQFHGGVEAFLHVEVLMRKAPLAAGHVERLVKQRVGQQRFRERMLDRFGATCALTGDQPESVLDAAHLYTYAERPVHEDDGGLLLRADVHRLFDRLLVTFEPSTWTSRVAPVVLAAHPSLEALEGRRITVPERLRPRTELIEEHHVAARSRWHDLEKVSGR
ncbi:HNH endonuclease [Actinotalea sp. Marseille-Q4924]|uniref:HNH endonuclease n=1 Tax=Actinotalea sp. Marseille-Q4924 TaxID=2866571 RepID=UPI001CE4550B|nr:HNH endonuclease [Actinotalea sp. Marseille-Q4924]